MEIYLLDFADIVVKCSQKPVFFTFLERLHSQTNPTHLAKSPPGKLSPGEFPPGQFPPDKLPPGEFPPP